MVKYAMDGSPGKGNDPRQHRHTWAAVAFKVQANQIEVVATAAGSLGGRQTVYRSEAAALCFVCQHTKGHVDVTLDCKALCNRVARGKLPVQSADLLEVILAAESRLDLHWINSHLTEEKFIKKFGQEALWRHAASSAVDSLAQEKAESRRSQAWTLDLKRRDTAVTKVNSLLQARMEAMLQYDKDQGPQVEFVKKPGPQRPGVKRNPAFTKDARGPLNRRQTQQSLLRGEQEKGHEWKQLSSSSNWTVKCSRCGLYVQQTDGKEMFALKTSQGCLGQPVQIPGITPHASHELCNLGREWACLKCGKSARLAPKVYPWIASVCEGKVARGSSKTTRGRMDKIAEAMRLLGRQPSHLTFAAPAQTPDKSQAKGKWLPPKVDKGQTKLVFRQRSDLSPPALGDSRPDGTQSTNRCQTEVTPETRQTRASCKDGSKTSSSATTASSRGPSSGGGQQLGHSTAGAAPKTGQRRGQGTKQSRNRRRKWR